jgi:hypothetical protein
MTDSFIDFRLHAAHYTISSRRADAIIRAIAIYAVIRNLQVVARQQVFTFREK